MSPRVRLCVAVPQARSVVFAGDDSLIFEGVVTMVACVMLTSVSFALLRMLSMQRKWEERLTVSTKARATLAQRARAMRA
jgi:high-affinity Fe2+/Pb2+ permease